MIRVNNFDRNTIDDGGVKRTEREQGGHIRSHFGSRRLENVITISEMTEILENMTEK